MKKIKLTLNKWALVDDSDYETVSQFKWCAHRNPTGVDKFYALRHGSIRMHRFILGLTSRDRVDVDHVNGNGLDNRRANLRLCTRRQNCNNRVKQKTFNGKTPSSRYLGVCFDRSRGKWMAYLNTRGHRNYLGRFESEDEAGIAYNQAALQFRDEFTGLNKIARSKETKRHEL